MSTTERRRDPGPTGTKYEADKRNIRTRNILALWMLIAVTVLAALNLYGTFVKNPADTRARDEQIRLSQYQVCLESGNALRQQVRAEFVDLKRDVLIPVFSGVAAVIPASPSRDILIGTVVRLKRRIATIDKRIPDADCLALYPPLPGQSYPAP